jgi:multiple sugar transport system permease protein
VTGLLRLRAPAPGRILAWAMLALFAAATLLPLWVALKTALSTPAGLFQDATRLVPRVATLDNFRRVLGMATAHPYPGLTTIDFGRALLNTLAFTVAVTGLQIGFSALAAYAFARLRFPGRDLLFFAMLAATMIPGIVLFIPNFLLVKELGWLNTFQGLVAPYVLMSPFSVFFLRQFFLSTPKELEEAARIDGASHLRTFLQIVLPNHKGAVATLAILVGVTSWNEFFWPFLVARDEHVRVMAVAMNAYRSQQQLARMDWTGLMACAVLSIVPVVVLLVVLGRRVVESLQFSGIK